MCNTRRDSAHLSLDFVFVKVFKNSRLPANTNNIIFFSSQVTAGEERLNAAYKGAIVMTGLSNFQQLLIQRDEWVNERSQELLKRWIV